MYYYCAAHTIAYEKARQLQGHWLREHPGEPRPLSDTTFVEQVPEGTKIADPPKGRRAPREAAPREPGPRANPAAPQPTVPLKTVGEPAVVRVGPPALDGDDEGAHLDQLLIGIGVPLLNRQAIVTGYRSFEQISQNPYNLTSFITTHLPTKLRSLLPLVIQEMFPGEQEDPAPHYFGQAHRQFREGFQYWPGQRPPYQPDWARESYAYDPRYTRPMPLSETAEPNPQVVALEKKVDVILGELQAERAARAKEQEEQRDKDRDAALLNQINAVATKLEGSLVGIAGVVKTLGDQFTRGQTDGERSHSQLLAEKVETLSQTITNEREATLKNTVEALRGELVTVSQKLSAEPTGKTTEDLISSALPILGARLESLGTGIKDELKGLREQAGKGQLPNLSLPNARASTDNPASTDPLKVAQQIAGARAVEDRIMATAGRQPRS